MFENIKNWILRGVEKMLSKNTIEEALKVKTAISDEMDKAMQLWLKIFTNNAPWLSEEISSLELGSSIAEEFTRLITLEMKSEVTGSPRAAFINDFYQNVLKELSKKLSLFNAVGGGFLKPYIKDNQIYVDFVPQCNCKPLSFDNAGNISSIVFISEIAKGDRVYTRLEVHSLFNNTYTIENKAYVKEISNVNSLGIPIDLSSVNEWSKLKNKTTIKNVNKPLFAYYKVPLANNIDYMSCLGISVYHKAIESLKKADIQASRLDYEYESGERSIYADVSALQNKNGTAKKQKLIKTLDTSEDNFYKEFSPSLRDDAYIRGLNKIKQDIEFQVHLSYGTISDPSIVEKTATEINASKQRSYSSVKQMQESLENALRHLVYILEVYCDLYNLAPGGKCEVSADWDDSIIENKDEEKIMAMQEVNAGLKSKKKYLMEIYGLSEDEAEKELEEIRKQNKGFEPLDSKLIEDE